MIKYIEVSKKSIIFKDAEWEEIGIVYTKQDWLVSFLWKEKLCINLFVKYIENLKSKKYITFVDLYLYDKDRNTVFRLCDESWKFIFKWHLDNWFTIFMQKVIDKLNNDK